MRKISTLLTLPILLYNLIAGQLTLSTHANEKLAGKSLDQIVEETSKKQKALYINGILFKNDEFIILAPWFLDEGEPDVFHDVKKEVSKYKFECLSETGKILHTLYLPDPMFEFKEPGKRRQEPLGFKMLYPESTAKVVFKKRGRIFKNMEKVLIEREVSKYPPAIILEPVTKKQENKYLVRWKAEDKDGNIDDITYVLTLHNNTEEVSFLTSLFGIPIKHNNGIGEFEFDTAEYKEGIYKLKMLATDNGFNEVEVFSESFEIKK